MLDVNEYDEYANITWHHVGIRFATTTTRLHQAAKFRPKKEEVDRKGSVFNRLIHNLS